MGTKVTCGALTIEVPDEITELGAEVIQAYEAEQFELAAQAAGLGPFAAYQAKLATEAKAQREAEAAAAAAAAQRAADDKAARQAELRARYGAKKGGAA